MNAGITALQHERGKRKPSEMLIKNSSSILCSDKNKEHQHADKTFPQMPEFWHNHFLPAKFCFYLNPWIFGITYIWIKSSFWEDTWKGRVKPQYSLHRKLIDRPGHPRSNLHQVSPCPCTRLPVSTDLVYYVH